MFLDMMPKSTCLHSINCTLAGDVKIVSYECYSEVSVLSKRCRLNFFSKHRYCILMAAANFERTLFATQKLLHYYYIFTPTCDKPMETSWCPWCSRIYDQPRSSLKLTCIVVRWTECLWWKTTQERFRLRPLHKYYDYFVWTEIEFLSKVLNCSTVSRNATNQHPMLLFPHQHHFIMGSLTV